MSSVLLRIIPMVEGGRPAVSGAPLVRSSRPDELVLTVVALDEGGVDRRGEGRIVELEREVLGARLASGSAPAGAELDTVCGDAIVWRLVVVAGAGLDGGLDVEGEVLDRPGVSAVLVAGEGADLRQLRLSGVLPEAA